MSFYDDVKALIMARTISEEEKNLILTSPEYHEDRETLEEKGALELLTADKVVIQQCFANALTELAQRFGDKKAEGVVINASLEEYICSVIAQINAGDYPALSEVAERIVEITNQETDEVSLVSLDGTLTGFGTQLAALSANWESENPDYNELVQSLAKVEYLDKVLDLVEMQHRVQVEGTEEYVNDVGGDVDSAESSNEGIVEVICDGTSECNCGCQMVGAIQLLEGLEDFFNGRNTPALRYLEGNMYANGLINDTVAGQEGPIFDKLKNGAMTVYKTLTESLKSMKDVFKSKDNDEKVKIASEATKNNSEAIAALPDQTAQVNKAAADGIVQLAEQVDPSGEMKNIVSGLTDPGSAVTMLDKLNAFMVKSAANNSVLDKIYQQANKALEDLRSAAGKLSSSDESNKDVVSVMREELAEKTKIAREAMTEAKNALTKDNKLIDGIKKAITATTPKIFQKTEEKKD